MVLARAPSVMPSNSPSPGPSTNTPLKSQQKKASRIIYGGGGRARLWPIMLQLHLTRLTADHLLSRAPAKPELTASRMKFKLRCVQYRLQRMRSSSSRELQLYGMNGLRRLVWTFQRLNDSNWSVLPLERSKAGTSESRPKKSLRLPTPPILAMKVPTILRDRDYQIVLCNNQRLRALLRGQEISTPPFKT